MCIYSKTHQNKIARGGKLLTLIFCILFNTSSYAIYQGSAGEAILIPLVLYDATLSINTTISITIPDKIGVSQIPNESLAPHTSPSDDGLPLDGKKIRWLFYDYNGVVRQDGYFNLKPNGIHTLEWKTIGSIHNRIPGYILLVTQAGYDGNDANFNIFAEAKFTIGLESANIPVYGMADGQENTLTDQMSCLIQGTNEVCEDTPTPPYSFEPRISPLSSGIQTGESDEAGRTVFDLMLGKRFNGNSVFGLLRGTEPTLLVVWNDGLHYDYEVGYVYEANGEYCSDTIPLNRRLNLIWILPTNTSPLPIIKIPATNYRSLCFPGGSASGLQSQYFKLELPTNPFKSASVAFSLVMGADMRMILARERGRFITESLPSLTLEPTN